MNDASRDPRIADFEGLVRDALLHLYDLAYLQTHPLLGLASPEGAESIIRVKHLRQALLDAIESLQPNGDSAATDRGWRTYRILELRYIEGHDVDGVTAEVNLGKSQYHREHHRALLAVTRVLAERWNITGDGQILCQRNVRHVTAADAPARTEAEQLVESDLTGQINALEILKGICALLEPLRARHEVRLALDLPEHVPPIFGERVALRQALLAILAHAFSVAGGASLDISMTIDGRGLTISIRGIGRDALDPSRLGIAESRRFVEALQGSLAFVPAIAPDTPWTILLSFPTTHRATLLVVDNSADFVRLVELYLVGRGWEVLGSSDVSHAFAMARDRKPSAILLDVVMPGRDGWDFLVELKATLALRDIPVVVCSVLDEPEVAFSLGAAAYLPKPVEQARLISTLDRLFQRQTTVG